MTLSREMQTSYNEAQESPGPSGPWTWVDGSRMPNNVRGGGKDLRKYPHALQTAFYR